MFILRSADCTHSGGADGEVLTPSAKLMPLRDWRSVEDSLAVLSVFDGVRCGKNRSGARVAVGSVSCTVPSQVGCGRSSRRRCRRRVVAQCCGSKRKLAGMVSPLVWPLFFRTAQITWLDFVWQGHVAQLWQSRSHGKLYPRRVMCSGDGMIKKDVHYHVSSAAARQRRPRAGSTFAVSMLGIC